MICDQVRGWILDALLGELDPVAQEELKSHLVDCESCAEESQAWRLIWKDLGTAAMLEPSVYGLDRLRDRVRGEQRALRPAPEPEASERGRSRWSLRAAALVAISLGLGALLGWLTASRIADEESTPPEAGQRYVMILSSTQEPPEQAEQVRREIGEWFRALGDQGVIDSFIGLAEEPAVGAPPERGLLADDVAGLIVFRARNAEEARRIAGSAPSLAYGGQIEVRRLD